MHPSDKVIQICSGVEDPSGPVLYALKQDGTIWFLTTNY